MKDLKNKQNKENSFYSYCERGKKAGAAVCRLLLLAEKATQATEIPYHIVKSKKRRKTLLLTIERDGRVVIRVPYNTAESEIHAFFKRKLSWVKKKIDEKKKRVQDMSHPRRFVEGEKFLYLGEQYPLEIREPGKGRGKLALSHGVFFLNNDCAKKVREIFIKWYKERACEIFTERVNFYSRKLKLYPKEIRISSAKTRYGSCTADNKLFFSFRLVMAPYSRIDYIIVHELAHIKIKNHSGRFWRYIEEVMPEYETHKKWLSKNSVLLDI